MESSTLKPQNQQQFTCPQLPLGVYREVVAHLRQVEGVNASLIMRSIEHNPAEKFDYYQSQVAALQIDYSENLAESTNQRIGDILDYYAQHYYPWKITLEDNTGR